MALSSSSLRRSGYGSCLRCLCKVVVVIVILFGGIYLVFWLCTRKVTTVTVVSATLSRFELADGPSGRGTLQYNLTVDIRVRNTNVDHISYDHAEAQAWYDTQQFGYNPVEPFSLKRKREHTFTATFGGSSPVDDTSTVSTYQRERSEGFYSVKLQLYYQIEFSVEDSNQLRLKSKIRCTLRLPVTNTSATPVTTQLETTCDKETFKL